VFCGAYFVGYRFSKEANPLLIVRHPLYFLQFLAAYLGMPFAEIRSYPDRPPVLGEVLGWLNLGSVLSIAVVLSRHRLLAARPALVLFGTYALTLCTILITAAGRMQIDDRTLHNALASRYLSMPVMTWAVTILIWFWFAGLNRGAATNVPAYGLLVAILLGLGFSRLRPWLADDATYYANYQMAALGLENGIIDASVVHRIFPDAEPVRAWSRTLRESNLSIYYKPMSRWLGRNVKDYAGTNETPVPGAIAFSYPLTGGVEIAGWADESSLSRSYKWVLLTNEQGEIVGIGEKPPAGFPRDLSAWQVPPSLGWIGFVNLQYPAKNISAYLVDKRRAMLFRLRGQYELPTAQAASAEQTGPSISGLKWSGTGLWLQGHVPAAPKGPVPHDRIYSSWGNSDRDQGEWHSSAFDTPAAGCLILPVLHGPRVEGLSVTVTDADSDEVIATAPMQDGMEDWNFWRIPIPAASKRVRVNASDTGIGWGQWVALTDPATCR
ncbi:MAG TPA: hypothetical protein VH302_13890, partial [Bryobacteraceae bacterium]|nr:hypothetical protein [Bryobacteraceae bacterium]